MKTYLIIMIAAIVGLSACTKNKNASIIAQTIKVDPNDTIPANSLNPYDSIGYWHNVVVAYVQSCYSPGDTFDLQAITNCVIKFANERLDLQLPDAFFSPVRHIIGDYRNNFQNVINECPCREEVNAAANSLIKLVNDLSVNTDYKVIKDSIVAYEYRITQNSGFTTDEQKVLLSAASVARYSTYYWMKYGSSLKTSRLFKDILKWGAYVAGDVTGAIATGNFECAGDCSVAMYYLVEYNGY